MTYIGSVRDAEKVMYLGSMVMAGMKEKAMSNERRLECPEGVEDFAERWFGAIAPVMATPPSDDQAAACIEAFKGFAERMAETNRLQRYQNQINTTLLSGMPAPSPQPSPEASRIAELEALLRASEAALALAASTVKALSPESAQHPSEPLKRACSVWPGRGGVSQLTGKPSWV